MINSLTIIIPRNSLVYSICMYICMHEYTVYVYTECLNVCIYLCRMYIMLRHFYTPEAFKQFHHLKWKVIIKKKLSDTRWKCNIGVDPWWKLVWQESSWLQMDTSSWNEFCSQPAGHWLWSVMWVLYRSTLWRASRWHQGLVHFRYEEECGCTKKLRKIYINKVIY